MLSSFKIDFDGFLVIKEIQTFSSLTCLPVYRGFQLIFFSISLEKAVIFKVDIISLLVSKVVEGLII